jgi:hypothetical protein
MKHAYLKLILAAFSLIGAIEAAAPIARQANRFLQLRLNTGPIAASVDFVTDATRSATDCDNFMSSSTTAPNVLESNWHAPARDSASRNTTYRDRRNAAAITVVEICYGNSAGPTWATSVGTNCPKLHCRGRQRVSPSGRRVLAPHGGAAARFATSWTSSVRLRTCDRPLRRSGPMTLYVSRR